MRRGVAHPLVTPDREALASDRLAVPYALHQAVAYDRVLVLACSNSALSLKRSFNLLPRRVSQNQTFFLPACLAVKPTCAGFQGSKDAKH